MIKLLLMSRSSYFDNEAIPNSDSIVDDDTADILQCNRVKQDSDSKVR